MVQRATVAGFRVAWRLLCRVPESLAYSGTDALAHLTYRRNTPDVQRLRANYARVRPGVAPGELEGLVAAGVRSYLRYWCEAFRLPAREVADVLAGVRAEGDEPVRAVLATGRPVVCFLGHMGNWDTAGAWATRELAPVVTVAERLQPEELFEQFLAFREGLGMTIFALTGDGDVFGRLVRRTAAGGCIVPLLADRDLTDSGVEVDFAGRRARMAPGPAALALATGAPLVPVSMRYEPHVGGPGGFRLVITFHPAVPRMAGPEGGGRAANRERIAAMTQACADALGAAIAEHTQDWHMMQRVFLDDLDPARTPPPAVHAGSSVSSVSKAPATYRSAAPGE
nr:phosphatidylinositol mannoside acyltransferase [Kineosphaera limosa]